MTKPVIDDAMLYRALNARTTNGGYIAHKISWQDLRSALEAALSPPHDRRWTDKPQSDRRAPAEPLPTGDNARPKATPEPEVTEKMAIAGQLAFADAWAGKTEVLGVAHIFKAMFKAMPKQDDPK